MPTPDNVRLADELRRLVLAIEVTGRAVLPSSNDELLETVVEAAARIFGAAASSIALVDEKQQALEFRVAYGAGHEQVVGMRIPLDQGIAGYVAMTGQPMAISNVQQDPRFAQTTAAQTGYVPASILAMPLLFGDRAIGVIEVLDKINAPSFGMQDMELLGIFARQAAIAIHSSQQYAQLGQALTCGIRDLAESSGQEDFHHVAVALEACEEGKEREADLTALAAAFNSIGRLGPAERQMCLQILTAFAGYARSKPGLF